MSLFDFIRLLYRNAIVLIMVPVFLAGSVILFTMNQNREYAAHALIYTGIASGFNIESGSDDKLDYKAVNNAFDNLIMVIESRVTLEEVSLRLLAEHLMVQGPTYGIIGAKAFTSIDEYITEDIRQKAVDTTLEMTYQRLDALYKAGNPLLQNLLNKGNSHWSIKTLGSIATKRVKSSDMVELAYHSTDPAVCQRTLAILLDVFSRRYKEIKQSETGDVVAYFQTELDKTKANLNEAEDRLTAFRVESRVINYVEQTKAIAFKKQNALEEFSMKKIDLKATEAALNQIEAKLKVRENILGKNVEILEKKQRLSEIAGQIAWVQNQNSSDSTINQTTKSLMNEQKHLKESLKKDVEMLFNYSNSKEGLPSKQLLNDWLNTLVEFEREKVIVNLYQQRLDDLNAEYDRFAPMGSTIARLERAINVYEREYMEVLHGLNMAKLREQNIELSNNIEVLDEPQLPLEPLPSKRMLLVIASFMFGFFSVVAVLVARALLDHSLQHPEKAKSMTQLEVAGALPVINEAFTETYGPLAEQVTGLLASKIKLEKYAINKHEATLIIGISTQPKEGKSFALKLLFDEMTRSGESVCLVSPESEASEPVNPNHFHYTLEDRFVSNKELIRDYATDYNYVLLEIPAWTTGKIPVHLIEHAQILLWTITADKVWSAAHKNMRSDLEKITSVKPSLILNGIKPYYLDQLVAELPVKRSFVARAIRKLVRFELGKTDLS